MPTMKPSGSASPLAKPLDGVAGAGALIHRIGCGLQLLSRCAEGHLADTLFGSFHAYQFHRIYPPWCLAAEKPGGAAPRGAARKAPVPLHGHRLKTYGKAIIAQERQKRYKKNHKKMLLFEKDKNICKKRLTKPSLSDKIHHVPSGTYALVAQLDRVTDYESVGLGFESLRVYNLRIS